MAHALQPAGDIQTRERLIAVAVELFSRHSYAGTSLQMIADELGLTKGAIYHHFRTREDLLRAIVAPVLDELQIIVEAAEQHRTPRARADHMLTGYAAHLVAHRRLAAVLALDPGVVGVLRANAQWNALIDRQFALLAAATVGPVGNAKATFVMAGMAAAANPLAAKLDDTALCDVLAESGRSALGLRAPRQKRISEQSFRSHETHPAFDPREHRV
jgi:AcrR family transcriptional regulator